MQELWGNLENKFYEWNLLKAVYKVTEKLRLAYAFDFGVFCKNNNNKLVAVERIAP